MVMIQKEKQDQLTRVRSRAPPQTQMKSRLHGWACSSSAGDTCPLPGRNLGNRDESERMMGWNVTRGGTSKTLSVKHSVSYWPKLQTHQSKHELNSNVLDTSALLVCTFMPWEHLRALNYITLNRLSFCTRHNYCRTSRNFHRKKHQSYDTQVVWEYSL